MVSVGDVIAIGQTTCSLYTSLQDHLEKISNNPRVAKDLARAFQRLNEALLNLATVCGRNDMGVSAALRTVYESRIRALHLDISAIRTDLDDIDDKLRRRLTRLFKAKDISTTLAEHEKTVLRMDQDVMAITMCFTQAEGRTKQSAALESAILSVADGVKSVVEINRAQDHGVHEFRPSYQVPRNPDNVVLKFKHVSDADASPLPDQETVETCLKKAVLNPRGVGSVGAVGFRFRETVGMKGMGGVGKSCALRGLAHDEQVRKYFTGGAY